MIQIIENQMDVPAFIRLRAEAGFRPYPRARIEAALAQSLYCVHIVKDGQTIGAARVVGDGQIAFFIKDVVVTKACQGQGFGHMMMEKIFQFLHRTACDGAYIGLMSTVGKEAFYQKHGFILRPNQDHGAGMVQFLKTRTEEVQT